MIKTPVWGHMTENDFNKVYEPSEDTFLLMDALERDSTSINELSPLICLEIGSGSGVVSSFLAALTGNKLFYMATDVNSHAALCTKKTANQNRTSVEVTVDDLGSAFKLAGKVDLLLFNPPYVVTPSEEVGGKDLVASWAGGIDGKEVIERFLETAGSFLSPSGLFYLLLIRENKPEQVIQDMKKRGFKGHFVLERKTGPEYLSVVRFSRDL